MTTSLVRTIATNCVEYRDHRWRVGRMGNGSFIQIAYDEVDVDTGMLREQRGRKWYVSTHATKSEVVQTMLLAALTSAEHRVREHFMYMDARVFMPHHNVDELRLLTLSAKPSKRKEKK